MTPLNGETSSHTMNSSFTNTTAVEDDHTVLGIFYVLMAVLLMFNNIIVVVVIAMSEELHLPTIWNMVVLALLDFLFGLYTIIFITPTTFLARFPYPGLEGLAACTLSMLHFQKLMSMTTILVDRYISVFWPLKYARIVTLKRFIATVIIAFVINVCNVSSTFVPTPEYSCNVDNGVCSITTEGHLRAVIPLIVSGACFLTTGFCLTMIAVEVVRSRRRVHTESINAFRANLKLSVSIGGIAVLFCSSFLPTIVIRVLTQGSVVQSVPKVLLQFNAVLVISNSVLNVVVYSIGYTPFRKAFLRLFCKKYYRRSQQREIQAMLKL